MSPSSALRVISNLRLLCNSDGQHFHTTKGEKQREEKLPLYSTAMSLRLVEAQVGGGGGGLTQLNF